MKLVLRFIALIRWFTAERIIGAGLLTLGSLIVSPYHNQGILPDFVARSAIPSEVVAIWFIIGGLYLLYQGPNVKTIPFCVVIALYAALTTANVILAVSERRASVFALTHIFLVIAFLLHTLCHIGVREFDKRVAHAMTTYSM